MESVSNPSRASCECLEHRMMFASPSTLMELSSYDRLGAWWNYDTNYTVAAGGRTQSGSGSGRVAVQTSTRTIDGHRCQLIVQDNKDVDVSMAWYTDGGGTHAAAQITKTNTGSFDLRLHDTSLAPAAMIPGRTYSDTGTFDGTFTAGVNGARITGRLTGTSKTTSRLDGRTPVTVPAGTFNAMKGTWVIDLTGSLVVRVGGQTYTAQFSSRTTSTFWAVPKKGVVRNTTAMTIGLKVPGEGSESVKVNTQSDLRSSSLFSTRRIRRSLETASPAPAEVA